MARRPELGRHSMVWASESARPGRCLVASGELGTNATAGFVYNFLGPSRTFTNRVQGGFGQAARQHGLVSFLVFLHPARKGMR